MKKLRSATLLRTGIVQSAAMLIVLAGAARAATVTGHVTTTNGVPLEGIDLDIIDHETGQLVEILDDDTGVGGSFDFIVPDGRYLIRFEEETGQRLVSREFRFWLLEGVVDWDLTLEVGSYLSGRVLSPGGQPVAGAEIGLECLDLGADVYTPDDETDAEGRFTVVVPTGCEIRMKIEPPAGNDYLGRAITTVVSADLDLGDVTLEAGHVVTGQVLNGGAPAVGVGLDAFDEAGEEIVLGHDNTDAGGNYAIVLPTGEFSLVARPRTRLRLAPSRVDGVVVTGDRSAPTLEVAPGVRLTGHVAGPGGVDVPDARLALATATGRVPVEISGGRSNEAGDYELVTLAGTYDVTASAPEHLGLAEALVTGVDLSTDATLDVQLDKMVPILGVRDFLAERRGREVLCSWTVLEMERFSGFRLLRARSFDSGLEPVHEGWLTPASTLPELTFDGDSGTGTFRYLDPEGSASVAYVLEAMLRRGGVERLGPIRPTGIGSPVTPSVVTALLSARPNPFVDRLAVELVGVSVEEAREVDLSLFDAGGRRVHTFSAPATAGANGVRWEVPSEVTSGLTPGIYFLHVQTGDASFGTKLVRVR